MEKRNKNSGKCIKMSLYTVGTLLRKGRKRMKQTFYYATPDCWVDKDLDSLWAISVAETVEKLRWYLFKIIFFI